MQRLTLGAIGRRSAGLVVWLAALGGGLSEIREKRRHSGRAGLVWVALCGCVGRSDASPLLVTFQRATIFSIGRGRVLHRHRLRSCCQTRGGLLHRPPTGRELPQMITRKSHIPVISKSSGGKLWGPMLLLSSTAAVALPQGVVASGAIFALSAVMHCAEAALTKLSVWQVKDLAATEGPRSPFASLPQKLTRYLVAISLTTTACSIYATALFVASVSALVPAWSLGLVSALLTFLTLLFGELLPKAVA
eukprot:gene24166-25876_t